MKILVQSLDLEERTRIGSYLRGANHEVVYANDLRSSASLVEQETPHICFVTVQGKDEQACEPIRDLRRRSPAVLAGLVRDVPEDFLIRLYDAGLDGELRIPFGRSYLLARVNAFERALRFRDEKRPVITGQRNSLPAPSRIGADPLAKEQPASITELVSRTRAWRDIPEALAGVASTFLTLAVTTSTSHNLPPHPTMGCSICLSNVGQKLELLVSVGSDANSARDLAQHLFGDADPELAADMLREISNVFMGSLKHAFGEEAYPFTGGLPQMIEAADVLRPRATYDRQMAFALTMAEARLVVHIGLRSKGNDVLFATGLREGMVLAQDVHNARGVLLLPSGTRLSMTMVERLRNNLPPKLTIQVMAA